jgi:hypothetical protein
MLLLLLANANSGIGIRALLASCGDLLVGWLVGMVLIG